MVKRGLLAVKVIQISLNKGTNGRKTARKTVKHVYLDQTLVHRHIQKRIK